MNSQFTKEYSGPLEEAFGEGRDTEPPFLHRLSLFQKAEPANLPARKF